MRCVRCACCCTVRRHRDPRENPSLPGMSPMVPVLFVSVLLVSAKNRHGPRKTNTTAIVVKSVTLVVDLFLLCIVLSTLLFPSLLRHVLLFSGISRSVFLACPDAPSGMLRRDPTSRREATALTQIVALLGFIFSGDSGFA